MTVGSSTIGELSTSALWRWRLGVLAVASGLFMEFVDSTALSTALPTLAKVLHSEPRLLKLALTSYMLGIALAVPASGWLASRFGARRIFLIASTGFMLGSLLCAASNSLEGLAAARLFQGLAAGMMTPVARVIVVETARPGRLTTAMAWFTTPALIGPLLGPSLAGLLLEFASWRWIFLINVPVGLAGIVAVWRFIAPSKPDAYHPFDGLGFALAALAISGVVVLADTIGISTISTNARWAVLLAILVSAGAYWSHARRTPGAILDFSLFQLPTFRSGSIGGLMFQVAIGAAPFLLPLLLQSFMGWSPLMFGLLMISQTLGALAAKPTSAHLIGRFGFRTVLIISNLAGAVLTAIPGLFDRATPVPLIAGLLCLHGFFRSLQFTATNTVVFAQLPKARAASASALSAVMVQVAFCLGISAAGFLIGIDGGALSPNPYTPAFLILGLTPALVTPFYRSIPAQAGRDHPPLETAREIKSNA
jgi:EmrB/QacA subfamily drug resistance transporter